MVLKQQPKEELVKRAKSLKQKEKLKLYNVIIKTYEDNGDITAVLDEGLGWSDVLFD